jgi:hypothetical protein
MPVHATRKHMTAVNLLSYSAPRNKTARNEILIQAVLMKNAHRFVGVSNHFTLFYSFILGFRNSRNTYPSPNST